jgi:hypothetical protein
MQADSETTSTSTPHDGPTTAPAEHPTIAVTTLDWRAVLAAHWQALGFEILGFGPDPRRAMAVLRLEWEIVVAVVSWFEAEGSITRAAHHLRTSRKVLRDRVAIWRGRHPHFVPRQPDKKHGPKTRAPRKRKDQSMDPHGSPSKG